MSSPGCTPGPQGRRLRTERELSPTHPDASAPGPAWSCLGEASRTWGGRRTGAGYPCPHPSPGILGGWASSTGFESAQQQLSSLWGHVLSGPRGCGWALAPVRAVPTPLQEVVSKDMSLGGPFPPTTTVVAPAPSPGEELHSTSSARRHLPECSLACPQGAVGEESPVLAPWRLQAAPRQVEARYQPTLHPGPGWTP